MQYKHISIIGVTTKKGVHCKIMYSKGTELKRFSTGILIYSPSSKQISQIKQKTFKYNWFRKDDFEKLKLKAEKYDRLISDYIEKYNKKPSPSTLLELAKRPEETTTASITTIIELFENYIRDKEIDFEELLLTNKDKRKRLERIKNIKKTIEFYCVEINNRRIPIEDLMNKKFWIEFLKFLLFEKPRNLVKSEIKPNHALIEKGESIFDPNFGISNSTVEKWIMDFNTIINSCQSNPFISKNRDSIKKTQKDIIKKLNIETHKNLEAALKKKEYDWLKSTEFEECIQDSTIDGGHVSRSVLVQAKDRFIGMTILGCRFSDFSHFTEANVIQRSQIANKTVKRHSVIINSSLITILERYNYSFPESNARFNKRIKEVFRQFYLFYKKKESIKDIDLKYVIQSHRGRYKQTQIVMKHEKIGAHSARRSFATMAYLEKRFPKQMIMEFTGHKSEREFDKYISLKVSEADYTELAEFFN